MANKKLGVCVFLSLFCVITADLTRKVATMPYPNCANYTSCSTKEHFDLPNLVYVKASTVKHDTLHYVFSTFDMPTIMIARTTSVDSDMLFNWNILLSNNGSLETAITFSKDATVQYKFAVSFLHLIEYDDRHDKANLDDCQKDNNLQCLFRNFTDIKWEPLVMVKDTIVFNTTDDTPLKHNSGIMSFTFRVSSEDGRVSVQPAQKYTANETTFDFHLDDYTPSFENSRFGLQAVIASQGTAKKMDVNSIMTIDDEYSPGVFQLTNLLSNSAAKSTSGFMQWKPVCYVSSSRGRTDTTKVKHYDLKSMDTDERKMALNTTLVSALFGDDLYDGKSNVMKLNISFGQPKDKFYVKNNYTVWSAAIGYGTPPQDELSMTVIIIISTGLGIPVLFLIIGGIFKIVKKVKRKQDGYETINGPADRQWPQ